jgi:predicted ATP-dependent endonuclease of OLD family
METFIERKICFNYGIKNEVFKFEKLANSFEIKITKNNIIENTDNLRLNYTDKGINFEEIRASFLFDFVTSIFHIEQEEEAKFFLPADRSFYASYYKYIYAALKDELKEFQQAVKKSKNGSELAYKYHSSYTSSVNSLISNIYNLNLGQHKANTFYEDLIKDLQKVIGGDIVSRSSNPDIASLATFKLKMENSEELDMHLSSSSVNQLTTLYLYFKYWARESGNTLIIDEPEENLHPKNQLALLNILMKFANRNNNRVILTTHSPLITDAVNNHLHLGYLADKYQKNIADLIVENNLDLDAEAALSHDDIGIYFFDGKSIKEYSVEEYGVDFKDFRKEQEKVEEIGDTLRGLILKQEKLKRQERSQKVAQNV